MPTIKIFINTTRGDISRAFVKSTAAATTDANPPALVVGNKRDVEVYLVDDAGNYDARSGAVGYSMAFGAGPVGAIPSGGTFTLSDGTNATAAIARNATAAQVQAALNAIDGGAGPFGQQVIVTTGAQGVYTVKFSSTGAVANLIGEGSELTPESTVVVNQSIAGSATVKERQFIRLMREPVVYTDTFTPIANGWSGTLSANNARAIELMAGKSIIATDLDVELTASGGVPETIARGQIAIANEVINPLTLDAEELAIALTIAAGDARYLQRSNDLSDLASASAARGNLGLSNVDNTSDASKPVSTAQQAAIDLKADITALTAETDAREAADNRRAFSGGVALSSGNNLVTNEIPFQNQGAFTFCGNFSFNSGAINGAFGIHSASSRGFGNNMLIRCYATNNEIVVLYYNGTSNYRRATASHSHGGNVTNLLIAFDGTSAPSIFVNGKSKTVTEGTSGSTPPNWSDPISGDFFIYGQAYSYGNRAATLSEVAILNTALTSAQAAEIYRDGLQPWLAANPEYRKGEEVAKLDAEDNSTSGWVVQDATGTASSITIESSTPITGSHSFKFTNTATGTSTNYPRFRRQNLPTFLSGIRYNFKCKLKLISGVASLSVRIGTAGEGSVFFGSTQLGLNSLLDVNTTITAGSIGGLQNAIEFYFNGTDEFVVLCDDIQITQLGALANLPLDDDSRQLKDISGNRNDATASEAGVNHLIQKDTHSFRDDNADGTGGSYLIANADILAENEVITGVTMDGRFYAATGAQDLTKRRIKLVTSGSHIEVKRSNGTTDDAANVTTHPASTTDFAVNVLTQRI